MKFAFLPAAAAAAALLTAASAQAATVTIDFENDAAGVKSDGFVSADYAGLAFFTDLGEGLEVGNYSPQSDGQGLLARNDTNGNFIKGVFSDGSHTFLSLGFGNDDPTFVNSGDLAILQTFLAGVFVGQTVIALTPNDVLDQTISYAGGAFDSFTFAYTNSVGLPFTGGNGVNTGLIEVIDNITFEGVGGVPEPSAWALMILGFGGVGAAMRRRQRLVEAA